MQNDLARDYALFRFDYNDLMERANSFITALQPLDPGATVITQKERFPVRSTDEDYEAPWRDNEREHDRYSAQNWCLHLRVETPEDVEPLAQKILHSGAEYLTGVYIGGDSFRQWAEPYKPGDPVDGNGVALHIYYTAPAFPNARIRGGALAKIAYADQFNNFTAMKAGIAQLCCVSVAIDWAESAEVIV